MAKTILVPILYLLGGVMIAPGAALAWFVWSVGSVASQKDLIHALWTALIRMIQALDWALFVVAPMLLVWLVLAFVAKYRWIGAGGMALAAVATLVSFLASMGIVRMVTEGDFFTAIAVVGLALNVWIVWDGWR
ncbi:MAG TPA: hypothetical protein VHY09_06475 [Candidatus Methylacidiphilales bacterium]|nr:hypothetical protein [Candidatus Methylacidiphilales bacterium]